MVLSPEKIAALAWPLWSTTKDRITAVAVALAESGGDTDVRSSTGDTGVWQVNDVHGYTVESLKDPLFNAKAARAVFDKGRGWREWSTFRNGDYLEHWDVAEAAVAVADGLNPTGSDGILPDLPDLPDLPGLDTVTGALSSLTPDGLAELVLTVGASLVLVAVGGVLIVVALGGLASRPVEQAKADVAALT